MIIRKFSITVIDYADVMNHIEVFLTSRLNYFILF